MPSSSAQPSGYFVRRPTPDDLSPVAAFLAIVTAADFGTSSFSEADLRGQWGALALDTDAWLICAPDGGVTGYAALQHHDHAVLQSECYVHPDHTGRGLGTFLIRATETRATEHIALAAPHVRVLLYNAVNAHNAAANQLLEQNGYATNRFFWRMIADLDAAPPSPAWPAGITGRTWASEADDHAVYLAVEEAFQDHWAYIPTPFESWRPKGDHLDPSLWFIACDGPAIVGALIAWTQPDMGWVHQLGVRRPWRQRGVGLALLQAALVEFYHRGTTHVGLDVDAESGTGAMRLYERAGMSPAPGHATTVYRKELRPGTEILTNA